MIQVNVCDQHLPNIRWAHTMSPQAIDESRVARAWSRLNERALIRPLEQPRSDEARCVSKVKINGMNRHSKEGRSP